jgi:hypothetical protein
MDIYDSWYSATLGIKDVKLKAYEEKYNGESVYRLTSDVVSEIQPYQLNDLGIRGIKRFKRYLKQAINKKSLYTINRILNYVHKRVLKLEKSPKMVCDKHNSIQKMRKEWLKQQAIADQLLTQYKLEKGDFYKKIK